MKINELIPPNYMTLNLIHAGETFEHEGTYYMKTNESRQGLRTCVHLSNGNLVELREDLNVKSIHMEGNITNGL